MAATTYDGSPTQRRQAVVDKALVNLAPSLIDVPGALSLADAIHDSLLPRAGRPRHDEWRDAACDAISNKEEDEVRMLVRAEQGPAIADAVRALGQATKVAINIEGRPAPAWFLDVLAAAPHVNVLLAHALCVLTASRGVCPEGRGVTPVQVELAAHAFRRQTNLQVHRTQHLAARVLRTHLEQMATLAFLLVPASERDDGNIAHLVALMQECTEGAAVQCLALWTLLWRADPMEWAR